MSGSGRAGANGHKAQRGPEQRGEMPSIWSSCMMVAKRGPDGVFVCSGFASPWSSDCATRRCAGDPGTQRLVAGQRGKKAGRASAGEAVFRSIFPVSSSTVTVTRSPPGNRHATEI